MRIYNLQQHKRHCLKCNKVTDQVKLDARDYYCLTCGTVGEPPLPDTDETLKAIMVEMSKEQQAEKKIAGIQ